MIERKVTEFLNGSRFGDRLAFLVLGLTALGVAWAFVELL